MSRFNLLVASFRGLLALALCFGWTSDTVAVNNPPVEQGPKATFAIKAGSSASIDVSRFFSDTDALTYTADNAHAGGRATANIPTGSSTMTVSAGSITGSTGKIIVTATDTANQSASWDFNFYVYNTPPADVSLSVSASSIDEDAGARQVTVTAGFSGIWCFVVNQTVSVSVAASGGVGAGVSPTSFNITIPALSPSASSTITVTPVDDNVDTADGTVNVEGTATNMTVHEAAITIEDDELVSRPRNRLT